MTRITSLLIVCSTSLSAASCLHRAESKNLLEERADYGSREKAEAGSLKLTDAEVKREPTTGIPIRTPPKVAQIWIYPHETPTKEYFWGGWISVVVEGDRWQTGLPNDSQPVPQKLDLNTKGKGSTHETK
ncbi:MAG: TraV family lipoprotein [Deltaproteobacteria bacterium]|nr:TraV family lipoprotein [Deltaproteobacteria bacterium]